VVADAVPQHDQRALGELGAQPAQHVDGVLAVAPRVGPHAHLGLVVQVEPVEGALGRQPGRVGAGALATRRPAVAEVGILVDVRLVNVDQQVLVAPSSSASRSSRNAWRWAGSARPSSFFFHDSFRRCSAAVSRQNRRPKRSSTQCIRRRSVQRRGPLVARRLGRGLLGLLDHAAERGLDLRAKGGPVRR